MAISNLKIVADKTSVKAGDTVNFTMTYNGSATYTDRDKNVWACDYVNVTTSKGYPNSTTKLVDNEYHSGNNVTNTVKWAYKIPLDWVGSKQLTHQVTFAYNNNGTMYTGVMQPSNSITIGVKGIMNPVVTLDPSNPTIRPGESALFSVNVTGVAPPFDIIKYEWRYKTSPIGGDTPTLEIPWELPGYEYVRCKVTVRKDGYDDTVAEGDTKLTTVNGTLEGNVGVMINGVPPSVKIFNHLSLSSMVTGAPANATILYEWLVNGIKESAEETLSYRTYNMTPPKVQLIVTVMAPNYTGVTVQSPVIEIPVDQVNASEVELSYSAAQPDEHWGADGKLYLGTSAEYNGVRLQPKKVEFIPAAGNVLENSIIEHSETGAGWSVETNTVQPSLVAGVQFECKYDTSNIDWIVEDVITGTTEYKSNKFPAGGNPNDFALLIDDAQAPTVYHIKAGLGESVTLKVNNIFDKRLFDPTFKASAPNYNTEMTELSKIGVYDVLDFEDTVVGTAVNNIVTFSVPSEVKTIEGRIRHTVPAGDLFTEDYVRYQPIKIDILANPMVPMPAMHLTQDPASVRLGESVKFVRNFTNLPADSDIGNTQWYINDSTDETTDELSVTASSDMYVIQNDTNIIPGEFDAAVVSAAINPVILKKVWPSVVLNLMPNNTVIPWGQFLVSGYDVVGEEVMDDLPKLTEFKPTWYLDGVEIPTLAGDGSLSIRATHPGAHVIKASVLLTHPDYENGELTVEQSFNMTTEPRDMATTVSILPNNAVIKIGDTQKFTATVTGAPVDATTTYQWFVGADEQASTQNNFDFTPTKAGPFDIKVIATTKAQDAADDVQEATVQVTVNKKVMTPKAVTTGSPTNPKIGDSYLFACAVTDTPAGATITYKWDSGETTQSINGTASVVGAISHKCTVTVKATDYDDVTVESNTATVTVVKKTQTTTASASTATETVKQDELYEAGVIVSGAPAGADITYLWNTGETTENIVGTATTVGTISLTCTVTVKHADYADKVITTNEVVITVEPKDNVIPGECPLIYVHPLPQRGSAYIWCGWWVMDAIESLTVEGKDWKTATAADSKYYCHLNVLAKMLVDFPEVDVQESRNGYIVHRSALEVGIIY